MNNINLLNINAEITKINKMHEDAEKELKRQKGFKDDLLRLIKAIIEGKDKANISNKETYEILNLKSVEKNKYYTIEAYFGDNEIPLARYSVKLTKTNIKKVEDYFNDRGFYC